MYKHTWISIVSIAAVCAAAGCQRENEVKEEVEELQRAEKESPKVAQDLREQLEEKKNEVAELEEKLALAEQGVTDRVIAERKDLQEAMKRQEQTVQREVQEAQGAAQRHNTDAERARRQLEESQAAGRVEATVKTERTVVPNETTTDLQKQQQQVPIETTKTIERRVEVEGTEGQRPAPPPTP